MGLEYFYMYDGIGALENEEQHKEHLRVILERFKKYGIILHPKKFVFGVEKVLFLGFLVNRDGITPLSAKVEAICKLERPEIAKQLRQFLGMTHFLPTLFSRNHRN